VNAEFGKKIVNIFGLRHELNMFMSQSKYVNNLLSKFCIHNLKAIHAPLPSRITLSVIDGD